MKMQRIAVMLTAINFVIMMILLAQLLPVRAQQVKQNPAILRGRGLEIVDSLGRLRASITMQQPVVTDGKNYAGGILLRLIDSKGEPVVKIMAAEDGGGISLANEKQGYIIVGAPEKGGFIKIKDSNGKEAELKP